MEDVLVDLFLAEGTATIKGLQSGAEKKQSYYNSVLKKHDITYAEFDSSTVWYSVHPDLYFKLLERVHKRLEKIQKEVGEGKYLALASKESMFDTIRFSSVPKEQMLNFPHQTEKNIFELNDTTNKIDDTYIFSFRLARKPKTILINSSIEVQYVLKNGETKSFSTNVLNISDAPYVMSYLVEDSPVVKVIANLFCYDPSAQHPVRVYLNDISFVRIRAKN